jgi:hypothetical protein
LLEIAIEDDLAERARKLKQEAERLQQEIEETPQAVGFTHAE